MSEEQSTKRLRPEAGTLTLLRALLRRASGRGVHVVESLAHLEQEGVRGKRLLELPRAQMESVRQTLVPVIRTLADALIGALGG